MHPTTALTFLSLLSAHDLPFLAPFVSLPPTTNITPSENQHVLHRIDGIDTIPTRRHL
jgi:hypothetical protein